MTFLPEFLKQFIRKTVKADNSVGEGVKVTFKEIPHQPYYNTANLFHAAYKTMQKNIRKSGLSVASVRPEKTDIDFDNATRKIRSGTVSYMLSVLTPTGLDREVKASVKILDDRFVDTIDFFEDTKGEKYAFNRDGIKAFLLGVEESNDDTHETVFPAVGDGGSQSGQAGGAEPNLAFVHNNNHFIKMGHQDGSKIIEANKKIGGGAK